LRKPRGQQNRPRTKTTIIIITTITTGIITTIIQTTRTQTIIPAPERTPTTIRRTTAAAATRATISPAERNSKKIRVADCSTASSDGWTMSSVNKTADDAKKERTKELLKDEIQKR
jgi:hypothetical protein